MDKLDLNYAFVGGAILSMLLELSLSPIRPTDDLDVIIQVATTERYSELEAKLRSAGFDHDTRQGAPRCRWIYKGLTVDIMPTEGEFIGLNTAWFKEALEGASIVKIDGSLVKIISPVAFIALKLAAFKDRGKADYYGSHDLEDLVSVIDGREEILGEIALAPQRMRDFIVKSLRELNRESAFREACPGFLPSDQASQKRLPLLRQKLEQITRFQI